MEPQYNGKQHALLLLNDKLEVLYGGAVGGGKSEGLLQSASQFLDVPGYSAILFRRTYRDLALPGALLSRSHQWWNGTAAHWDGVNYTWRFPEGSTLAFGYMEGPNDMLRYQSAEFQFVGIDEVTQFSLAQYTYMFSRLRRLKVNGVSAPIPIRMRGATNPGGPGHEWVRDRFNLPEGPGKDTPQRAFISATLEDNPYLDQEEYERSLAELPEVTRKQLRRGDWTITGQGGKFLPERLRIIPFTKVPDPHEFTQIIRFWDLASTAWDGANDPDWTVGLKLGKTRFGKGNVEEPDWYVLDVCRFRDEPAGVERMVKQVAHRDGRGVPQWFEQERGGSGKGLVGSFATNVLPYHEVHGLPAEGSKGERAVIPAARVNEGRVYMVDGEWNRAFMAELGVFSDDELKGRHDDQVDALSGGFIAIERQANQSMRSNVGQY